MEPTSPCGGAGKIDSRSLVEVLNSLTCDSCGRSLFVHGWTSILEDRMFWAISFEGSSHPRLGLDILRLGALSRYSTAANGLDDARNLSPCAGDYSFPASGYFWSHRSDTFNLMAWLVRYTQQEKMTHVTAIGVCRRVARSPRLSLPRGVCMAVMK